MSESNIIGGRSPNDGQPVLQEQSSSQSMSQQSNQAQISRRQSKKEEDMNKAKRKSNAYMAAEAVQHERDAVTALKRLSIGRSSINVDPDLPYGVDGDFNYNDYSQRRHHRKRSSQDSSSSASSSSVIDDDKEKTLVGDDEFNENNPNINNDNIVEEGHVDQNEEDEDVRLNAEKLLWVPAKSHPSIAPDQFRRHVQSTIDDMNNKLGDRSPVRTGSISSISTRDSIPSLKELTDELDRLSEMAGLAATDAVTLARSLSSASGSSTSLLLNNATTGVNDNDQIEEDPRFLQESTTGERRPSQEDIDQDAPILSEGSSSLKRNKWTTYSRSNRLGKDKLKKSPRSPLADEHHQFTGPTSHLEDKQQQPLPPPPGQQLPSSFSKTDKDLPPSPKDIPERTIPLQDPKEQQKLAEQRGRSNLSRSQSDTIHKRTNHSRNRHAGSLINVDNQKQQPSSQQPLSTAPQPSDKQSQDQQNPKFQRRVVSHDSYPKSHSNLHQVQQRPLHQERLQKANPQQQQHHHQSPAPPPIQKQAAPAPPQPQTSSKEAVQENESTPVVPEKAEKTKKDNSFLKMFKKKRSTSPKNQKNLVLDNKRSISSGKGQTPSVNDENCPPIAEQQEQSGLEKSQISKQQQSKHQPEQPQAQIQAQQKRPSLKSSRSSTFKFSKQSKSESKEIVSEPSQQAPSSPESNKLQESVDIVPQKKDDSTPSSPTKSYHQQTGQAINEEQHRIQKETLSKKLSMENMNKPSKPNAPVQFTDSAFGFPLPPLSNSTVIMLDYRFPIHVERALYRLSHLKLANPRRPLRQQVLLSNFMYSYLNLVNHTLYLQQLDENGEEEEVPLTEQEQINTEA